MKTLYVMRHAKSSWKDTRIEDHQRPLNPRGKRNVKDMGGRFKARGMRLDHIVSSDARRTMDTADALVDILGLDPAVVRPEPGLYAATESQITDIVKQLDDRWHRVMIVGHNPGLTQFANRVYPQSISNLPTAGVVELHFDVHAWRDIDRRLVVLSDLDYPKNK
jgi:phosphohistidine phosphatase